ncbi:14044_t:CDS:1 [Racocetra persica]|uniref:14044_t:CDS:1 n=1 Tax=Racocetra persica TaxID=160502 RepID=A0ACA9RMF5_9GLOM|nr:14044_t:CDS:1 [Racocetra persica]
MDMMEYNGKKSKQIKVEIDDVNDRKIKHGKNNYVDSKEKIKINKMIKNNEKSSKKKKEQRKGEHLLEIRIRRYLIVKESC